MCYVHVKEHSTMLHSSCIYLYKSQSLQIWIIVLSHIKISSFFSINCAALWCCIHFIGHNGNGRWNWVHHWIRYPTQYTLFVYSSLADVEGPLCSIVMPDRQPGEETQKNLIENNPILTFAKSTALKVLPLYDGWECLNSWVTILDMSGRQIFCSI